MKRVFRGERLSTEETEVNRGSFETKREFKALLFLVSLTPLPFGSVYPWSWNLLAIAISTLLFIWWGKSYWLGKRYGIAVKSIWPVAAMFSALVLIVVFQSMTISPGFLHHPFWSMGKELLATDTTGSISINREATVSSLVKLLTYGGIFWLSYQYSYRSHRALLIVRIVAWVGTAYATYGLFAYFWGGNTILWFEKFAYRNDLTSTFVNRNSYATYAGLALICVTALMIESIARLLRYSSSWRERIRRFLEDMTANIWFPFVAWMVLTTSLLLSHSRAGFAATVIGLGALTATFGKTKMLRRRTDIFLWAVPLLAVAIVFAFSGQGLDQRFAQTSLASEERPAVYRETLKAASRTPFLGAGYGTFEEVFRSYRTPALKNFYRKAHNTYLEILLEVGVLGAVLIIGIHLYLVALMIKGVLLRKRGFIFPCIGVAATALIAVHSVVDFSIQIPAVAATYWLIMGAACSQSFSSAKKSDPW